MKHTKSPWQLTTVPFELRNTDSAAAIYGPIDSHGGSPLIADISRSVGDDEATANAKIIVASPEMLEALKEWAEKGATPHAISLRDKAIKKATE